MDELHTPTGRRRTRKMRRRYIKNHPPVGEAKRGRPPIDPSKKPDVISDEEMKEFAKTVPKGMLKMNGKHQQGYTGLNRRLANMKKLDALNWYIVKAKMQGKSDREIAEKLGCCADTIQKHKKRIQGSAWFEAVTSDLMDLEPEFRESLKYNAAKGDPYTTVAFYKGMQLFRDRAEITLGKIDKDEQIRKFKDQVEKVLGVSIPKSRLITNEN